MAYALPPNNLIAGLVNNETRRRQVYDRDLELRRADWQTIDPSRGPVRGWSGGGGRRTG